MKPEEIRAFYDELWSRESPETNRHERARFAEIFALASGLRRAVPEILDAGCGTGKLAVRLAALGPVTGVDWSDSGVEASLRRVPEGTFARLDLVRDDSSALRGRFGLTVCSEVLEHVGRENRDRLLERLADTLAPGGFLILTTPNGPRVERLRRWLKSHQPEDDLLTLDETRDVVRRAGLQILECRSAVFGEGAWEASSLVRRLRSMLPLDLLGRDVIERVLSRTTLGIYVVLLARRKA